MKVTYRDGSSCEIDTTLKGAARLNAEIEQVLA